MQASRQDEPCRDLVHRSLDKHQLEAMMIVEKTVYPAWILSLKPAPLAGSSWFDDSWLPVDWAHACRVEAVSLCLVWSVAVHGVCANLQTRATSFRDVGSFLQPWTTYYTSSGLSAHRRTGIPKTPKPGNPEPYVWLQESQHLLLEQTVGTTRRLTGTPTRTGIAQSAHKTEGSKAGIIGLARLFKVFQLGSCNVL